MDMMKDVEIERFREKVLQTIKLSELQSRILIMCKTPKRPREVWLLMHGSKGYTYISNIMSQMSELNLMTRRNQRERGKNATWYTSIPEAYILALKVLKLKEVKV